MPGFTPGRRWQPPTCPSERSRFGVRLLETVEKWSKGRCSAAGCAATACCRRRPSSARWSAPRALRNGPCGGSTAEHCYVDETRPCIWYKIYDRAFKMGREEKLLEVLPPLDWDKVGGETWGDVVHQVQQGGHR